VSGRVLLIGGTSDARELARALRAAGIEVLVSTATDYGAELAAADAAARAGALDAAGMAELAAGCAAIVDASHPFAHAAREAAREAACRASVAYVRFERPVVESAGDALVCATAEDAARAAVDAAGAGGTVLLTVGSRTLETYAGACRAAGVRCVARVLPVAESLAACTDAGLGPADVVAMQGPTSAELDEALLRHLGATVLVTKDSGLAGGVPAKLEAAKRAGALAIIVARPVQAAADAARSIDDAVAAVLGLPGGEPPAPALASATDASATTPALAAPAARIGLIHVYTGAGKGKTTASVGLAARAAGAEAAEAALTATRAALAGGFDLVVLDEACVAAAKGLVDPADLAAAVRDRAPHAEVVLTGRGAPAELLELADYISELQQYRHPYKRGVRARKGIEY